MRVLKLFISISLILLVTLNVAAKSSSEEKKGELPGVAAGRYKEAPMLAEMVRSGALPAVDERVPKDPAVLTPIEQIGKYGGTIRVAVVSPNPWDDLASECGATLLRVSEDGSYVEGNIAKSYELSQDGKLLTLYLRDGLKWSDGEEFTADDIVFQFEDCLWNYDIPGTSNRLPAMKRLIRLDEMTVRFEADDPYFTSVMLLAPAEGIGWRFFKPKHYFQKWHIKYNPDAEKLAKDEGYENWAQAISYHMNWAPKNDLDVPTVAPWQIKVSTTSMIERERNPYYWKVDTDGNQLPYVDKVVSVIVDPELYNLKIIGGEVDIAQTWTSFSNYPSYKQNAEAQNYRVITLASTTVAEIAFSFNLNDKDMGMRKLYEDLRFRQALSLAINREEINEVLYFGLAVPLQLTAMSSSSFYKEEWGKAYAQFDPKEANRLLDEVGLKSRDSDGFRIGPNGKTLELLVECGEIQEPRGALQEMVKSQWEEEIGIKVLLKFQDPTLYSQRSRSSDHGILAAEMDDMNEPALWSSTIQGKWARGGGGYRGYAWEWKLWLEAEAEFKLGRKTLKDFEGGKLPGEEPPENIKEYNSWIEQWSQVEYGSAQYKEIAQKIFDFNAEHLFRIGTVGLAPFLYIAKNNIGNVPTKSWANFSWTGSPNMVGEQLFFKD